MDNILPSSKLFSHPDRLLEDHLIGTSNLINLFLSEKPKCIENELFETARIIALSHDLGKATNYFQRYLFAADDEKEKLKSKETHHSLFSAVCAFYLTKQISGISDIYPLFAYVTVRRHHSNLINILDEVSIFDDKDNKLLNKQLESIDDAFAIIADKLFWAGLPIRLDKNIISQWINSFNREIRSFRKIIRNLNSNLEYYIKLNLLYSLLLDADKNDVVIKEISIFERKFYEDRNWVDFYKKATRFPPSPINEMRQIAYEEAMSKEIELSKKFYSLNLPTGLGKTLISLSFALKLKDKLKQTGINPRIVYALPFLSIIDQNSKIFEAVIKANGVSPDSKLLLKHHHLSEIYYKIEEDELEPDEAKILIEGWNSEIIVTTFIQLFHTLITNKNRSIRKFHRLANSIIILDEVQSIPTRYWFVVREIFNKITEMLNARIIISTATEPFIFESGKVFSLVNKETYFNSLNRISLIPNLDKSLTLDELKESITIDDDKTYLFIFNTISSAREFYRKIKEENEQCLAYLSTHITPKERRQRIDEIKKGKYKIVVSTQLVEAGVDIDFDVVVRDFAPLDSLNQSAGRCNRNGNGKGLVLIVALTDSKGKKYASYIYDPVLLDITEKILSKKQEIREKEFLKLLEEYYFMIQEKTTQAKSKEILEAVCRLRYERDEDDERNLSVSDFSLIEEDYPKMDVFIEIDEEAEKIWNEFKSIININDRIQKKQAFDGIKSDFYSYVISIPQNAQNMPEIIGGIGYVKRALLDDYYDRETGFKIKDEKSVVIW